MVQVIRASKGRRPRRIGCSGAGRGATTAGHLRLATASDIERSFVE
jgi:hypothetical protein